MRIAVVGCGPAGAAVAALLAGDNHRVTVFERAAEPGPVGAGILLQQLGQQVLERIGVAGQVAPMAATVDRVDIVSKRQRPILAFSYADAPGAKPAWGLRRSAVFGALFAAVRSCPADIVTGSCVTDVRPSADGVAVEVWADSGRLGRFDLVVGADGARSQVRASSGIRHRDRSYRYGALWAIVDGTGMSPADRLYQCLDGTRRYLGVLPTGSDASLFWSLPAERMDAVLAGDIRRWREQAIRLAGPYEELVGRVDRLLPARYRDVVVPRPYRLTGPHAPSGVVLIGDAAHAMSPQLGAGTSLGLCDCLVLAGALRAHPGRLDRALVAYTQARRAHLRWYTWWSRLMMPLFQSDLDLLAPPRDLLAGPVGTVPPIRREFVRTLAGTRRSLGRPYALPED